jgi:hypothetical protein
MEVETRTLPPVLIAILYRVLEEPERLGGAEDYSMPCRWDFQRASALRVASNPRGGS